MPDSPEPEALPSGQPWRFFIDAGGTFTDCIGVDPESGELHTVKVLSGPDAPERAIRAILVDGDMQAVLPPLRIRMGTTQATNALLERRGSRVLLVTNQGMGDLLLIGDQSRPELFKLEIEKPSSLVERSLEVAGRLDSRGRVLEDCDEKATRKALGDARREGLDAVAVVLLHAHINPEHEERICRWAREAGFEEVIASNEAAHVEGLLRRADTATSDAYLSPALEGSLRAIRSRFGLERDQLLMMQSGGGLVSASVFRGKDAVMSGPAGGAIALSRIASTLGFEAAIGFDMGGTSTDVCRWSGEIDRRDSCELAGIRIHVPMLDLHTVAAGGGSICAASGRRLTVGPESAGSSPGPICYGRQGAEQLTVTDLNLYLGRVVDARFPFRLERGGIEGALLRLRARIGADASLKLTELATGLLDIADEHMAAAIRKVTVQRGHDLRTHAMVVFGGAGGQHACSVADRLGISTLAFPALGGVLSAYGIGRAPLSWERERALPRVNIETETTTALLDEGLSALRDDADAWVASQASVGEARESIRLELAYAGSQATLLLDRVREESGADLRERFEVLHERTFGYRRGARTVEARSLRLRCQIDAPDLHLQSVVSTRVTLPNIPDQPETMYSRGRANPVRPIHLEELRDGREIRGPALVLASTTTISVDPGWTARLETHPDEGELLRLQRHDTAPSSPAHDDTKVDPVSLELFNRRFASIAEEMGLVLQRTAASTNIRDRLDFSCALFDSEGRLVANAPHIPVHLGSMSETVRAVSAAHPDAAPGTAFVSNDPSAGGSHLPDITVVNPVHDKAGALRFFVASRGHHSDVGGSTPGSMPADSTSLEEEGIVLRTLPLVADGRLLAEELRDRLGSGPFPARHPEEVLADLEAQLAANRRGATALAELAESEGANRVSAFMKHVQDHAAERVRNMLSSLSPGERSFEDQLDDGSRIRATLQVRAGSMRIDFSGSSGPHAENFNAPRAVSIAATLYVLRCLIEEDIPLNAGCFDPIELFIPPSSLLDPPEGAAVVAGNVETSQRIVDVLLGALGRAAASQGTMNNISFGAPGWGYYETLAGGAGGTPLASGASAVHTHMTNTRLTDPEVLEARYPIRLWRNEIRRGSGGAGIHPGGEGLIRELEFLEGLSLSILSERRTRRPWGLAGGSEGWAGSNRLDGVELGGRARLWVQPGQRLRIATPGGGGWGAPGAKRGQSAPNDD
jgi:5-oxoprolinase (ATP-hydrolysing)